MPECVCVCVLGTPKDHSIWQSETHTKTRNTDLDTVVTFLSSSICSFERSWIIKKGMHPQMFPKWTLPPFSTVSPSIFYFHFPFSEYFSNWNFNRREEEEEEKRKERNLVSDLRSVSVWSINHFYLNASFVWCFQNVSSTNFFSLYFFSFPRSFSFLFVQFFPDFKIQARKRKRKWKRKEEKGGKRWGREKEGGRKRKRKKKKFFFVFFSIHSKNSHPLQLFRVIIIQATFKLFSGKWFSIQNTHNFQHSILLLPSLFFYYF